MTLAREGLSSTSSSVAAMSPIAGVLIDKPPRVCHLVEAPRLATGDDCCCCARVREEDAAPGAAGIKRKASTLTNPASKPSTASVVLRDVIVVVDGRLGV